MQNLWDYLSIIRTSSTKLIVRHTDVLYVRLDLQVSWTQGGQVSSKDPDRAEAWNQMSPVTSDPETSLLQKFLSTKIPMQRLKKFAMYRKYI